jgi:acid phosphatase (class A)
MIGNRKLAAAAAVVLTLLTGPAFADVCPEFDPLPLSMLLTPPPADYSEESLAELRELQELQGLRTGSEERHAQDDQERTVQRFLADLGVGSLEKAAVALDFFKCVADAANQSVGQAKSVFARTRPYAYLNSGLHPLKKVGEDSPSYPSGHATYGMVVGLLLADMLPEKKEQIFARIEDFGASRLMSGVHFRSDVYAGQIAGAAIVASSFASEDFRRRFEEAKKDLRSALGYPAP